MKLEKIGLKNTGLELSKGEKSMPKRHYLRVEDKAYNKIMDEFQIIKDDNYFDEEFYKNLNIHLDENGLAEPVRVNYVDFLYEWVRWLNRHPDKKELPQISEAIKRQEDINALKQDIFSYYTSSLSHTEQKLYYVSRMFYPAFVDWRGNVKQRNRMTLEVVEEEGTSRW